MGPERPERKDRDRRAFRAVACTVSLILALLVYGTHLAVRALREENRLRAQQVVAQDLAKAINDTVIQQFQGVARALATDEQIIGVARGNTEPDNHHVLMVLNAVRNALNTSLVYVLDRQGTTVSCTPYGENQTLTGKNYAFRPYFVKALDGHDVIYFALGVTTNVRGLYFSSPVRATDDAGPVGVVVVKDDFAQIDQLIGQLATPAAFVSPDGVILASNQPDWLYRVAFPIAPARREALLETKQFADQPLLGLQPMLDQPEIELAGARYTVVQNGGVMGGWRVVTLERAGVGYPLTGSQKRVLSTVLACTALLLSVTMSLVVNVVRRKRAEQALKLSKDTLELRVAERTGELARANEELKASQQRLADIISFLPDATFAIDQNGRVTAWNRAMEELTGVPADQIIGEGDYAYAVPFYGARRPLLADLARTRDDGIAHHYPFIEKRGDVFITEVQAPNLPAGTCILWAAAKRLHDLQGNVVGAIEAVRDITKRKRTEEALRQSKERFDQLAAQSRTMTWEVDAQGLYTYASKVWRTVLGYQPEELVGRIHFYDFHPEHGREAFKAAALEAFARREAFRDLLNPAQAKDGRIVWLSTNGLPILDEHGTLRGYRGWDTDVTERQRGEESLLQTCRELEEATARANTLAAEAKMASAAKSEFLANMSHEIRTPMTAILGFAELMGEGCPGHCDYGRDKLPEALGTIRRNGEHLLGLLGDILDLAKVEAGKVSADLCPCSPHQIVAEVVSLMRVRAEAGRLHLDVEFATPIPETIRTDALRLRQILVNLVGNAIKFTEAGGVKLVLSMVCHINDPRLQCDVIDTGIGMTDDQARRIFQPFSQADTSTTRQFGGTGLGLAISRRLAGLLDGEVVLVSTKPGEGTRFRAAVAVGPMDGVRMLEGDENRQALGVRPQATAETPNGSWRQGQPLEGVRVLLAEDGPDNQRLISHFLSKAGAEVIVAQNGREAIELAMNAGHGRRATDPPYPFHVILMDMQMPVMDGFRAVRMLRAEGYGGPVIALTAHAMAEDRRACLDAGCDEYASKPIDRGHLIQLIRSVLSGRASTRAADPHEHDTVASR